MRASLVSQLSHSDPVTSARIVEVTIKPFLWQVRESGSARGAPHPSSLRKTHLFTSQCVFLFEHSFTVWREKHQSCAFSLSPLTLASLGLFELQRDGSLPLPHRHSVWIVISSPTSILFPCFLPLPHHVSLSWFLMKTNLNICQHVFTEKDRKHMLETLKGETRTSICYHTENR